MKLIIYVTTILVLVGCFTLSDAEEDRWKYFASNGNDALVYYDSKSVAKYGDNMAKVWVKIVATDRAKSLFKEEKSIHEFNCTKREYRDLERQYGKWDGTTASFSSSRKDMNGRNEMDGEWQNIDPETWFDSLYYIVCKKK